MRHNLNNGAQTACQICGSFDLVEIIHMGDHAPCDSLLSLENLKNLEKVYPLCLVRCNECSLIQINYVVDPNQLFFPEYPYRTGITATLRQNLQSGARRINSTLRLPAGSLVVDLGSNDGSYLKGFQEIGMKVVGVEPTNIAKLAIANGIPTIQQFFSKSVAKEIVEVNGKAKLVTAANMFAHVSKLNELINGVSELIDDGIFVSESHYLLDIVEKTQFDSIYHEHLRYYSLHNLKDLFQYYGFTLVDAERIPNYGGSIRAYATKNQEIPVSDRLRMLLDVESTSGILEIDCFRNMAQKIFDIKEELSTILKKFRSQGKTICGIGCPGRASTLLAFCDITTNILPYIAEQSSSLKLGLYTPNTHIPIVDEKIMFREQPDYVLMLSWHYSEPIIENLRRQGLQSSVIVPLPEIKIID